MVRFFALLIFGCWIGTLIWGGEIIRRYETRSVEQYRQLVEASERNMILDRALDLLTVTKTSPLGNKFKKHDAIWTAKEELKRARR